MENKHEVHWEKIGVYLAIAATFLTVIVYIADMKERIAKLEVKTEKLEEKNGLAASFNNRRDYHRSLLVYA